MKEYFQLQKVVKMQCKSFEFIFTAMYIIQRGHVQVVVLYKYPNSSQTEFKKDLHCHLRPEIDPNAKLVILGDFNVQKDSGNTEFISWRHYLGLCSKSNSVQQTLDQYWI